MRATITWMPILELLGALLRSVQGFDAEHGPCWLRHTDDISFTLQLADDDAAGQGALAPIGMALASERLSLLERRVEQVEALAQDQRDASGPSVAASLERIAQAMERQAASVVSAVEPAALSKADAARLIGVDEGTVEQLVRTRKLAYVRHGAQRGRVITVEALRAFLQEYRQPTGDELAKARKRL